jgi:glycosyltransferase involved in cell wall biosynthesis
MIDHPVTSEGSRTHLANSIYLRIAGVDPERNFGGGETQVIGLTLELLRMGHRAELFCDPDGRLWGRAQAAGVKCYPLRVRNAIDVAAGLRLRALLAHETFDVIHFHTARAHALAPYAAGDSRLRVVTRRMDYPPSRWSARCLYNLAVDGVIAISAGVAEALIGAGVTPDRIRIVRSGVDCTRFAPPNEIERQTARAKLDLKPNEVAIGAVGTLTPRKGHRVLIDAVVLARKSIAPIEGGGLRCLIGGAGPLHDELTALARDRNCTDIVRMLGAVEDMRALLAALDIFVMPSLNEGLGIAALEATAMGLPVVASAVGGLPEVVEDGVSGMLFKSGDATALAAALIDLATNPARRAAAGAAARRRALAKFSVQAMAQGNLDYYRELIKQRDVRSRRGQDRLA